MSTNHEKFKNIASGLQSIFIIITFAIGGIWTIYTFDVLSARDRAKVELKEIEKNLHQQAVVNVDLSIKQVDLSIDNKRYINITANIENTGNRSTRLELGDRVIAVIKINYDSDGELVVENIIHSPVLAFADETQANFWSLPYTIIDSGETRKFPFFIQVGSPGIYLIGFQAIYSGEESIKFPQKVGGSPGHIFTVSGYEYFVVK